MRQLPEEAAGGSRQQPEAAGKSFEAAGKSFEAAGKSFEASGKSFEAAGKSFEASGKSFEAQASGRGQRQARASFSWPGISFSPKKALLDGFYLPPSNLSSIKRTCPERPRQRPHGRGRGLRAAGLRLGGRGAWRVL